MCELAARLSSTVVRWRPFLVFHAMEMLIPFAASLCRLVGASLGKGATGLYPLTVMGPCRTDIDERKASVVILKHPGDNEPFLEQTAAESRRRGISFLEIQVKDSLDFLRQTFLWQLGTVFASARMGVDPFHVGEARLP